MTDASGEIAASDLLEKLAEEGISVTRHQLVRWHKRGLLPRPRTKKLGRPKGSETLYPRLALWQTYVIALLRDVFARDLDAIGWCLWCFGFPVESLVRRVLDGHLDSSEQDLRKGYAAFASGADNNPITKLTRGRVPPAFGPVRRRVGKDRVATIGRMTYEVLLGQFNKDDYNEEKDGDYDLVGRAIEARLGGHASVAADAADRADAISLLSAEANVPKIRNALGDVSDKKLRLLRNEAQTLFRVALGNSEALVPPPVFLWWFSFRHVSPSINEALQSIDKSILPQLQPTMLERVAIAHRRHSNRAHPPKRK